jgi:hypothetical protein
MNSRVKKSTKRKRTRKITEITSDDDMKLTQDRQCTYNVIMGSFGATIVGVEKQ